MLLRGRAPGANDSCDVDIRIERIYRVDSYGEIDISPQGADRQTLILFDNGKLYRDNFKKARIDISDFLTHCRNQGYFDLSKLRTAVFEYNGSLSLLPVDDDRPLTPADIELETEQEEIMVNVILDGHISDANLKKAGFERVWLERQLHEQGFHSAKEVFLGMADTVRKSLQLYPMKVKKQNTDPFE